jgi:hypothetical protein
MKLNEIKLPDTAKAMALLGTELTLNFRKLAVEFSLTLDGSMGAGHNSMPLVRKNSILMGGWLRPKNGIKGEAAQIIEFEKRVELFLRKLYGDLGKIQVSGLGDDLSVDYHVYIGTSIARDGSGMKKIEEITAKQWFDMLAFAPDHRKLPGTRVTWMLTK